MQGHLETGIHTPMAQGRSTKIISMIEWIRTSRLLTKKSLFGQMAAGEVHAPSSFKNVKMAEALRNSTQPRHVQSVLCCLVHFRAKRGKLQKVFMTFA